MGRASIMGEDTCPKIAENYKPTGDAWQNIKEILHTATCINDQSIKVNLVKYYNTLYKVKIKCFFTHFTGPQL
jgi:hypothetical protein